MMLSIIVRPGEETVSVSTFVMIPHFLLIFIAFNVLASSIGSVLGYKWDDILLVNVENVSNVTKLILIIFYIVIFKNTELPNSFFIRFASKNEALLDRRN